MHHLLSVTRELGQPLLHVFFNFACTAPANSMPGAQGYCCKSNEPTPVQPQFNCSPIQRSCATVVDCPHTIYVCTNGICCISQVIKDIICNREKPVTSSFFCNSPLTTQWYFDKVTRTCQPVMLNGCDSVYNANKFKSMADCQITCSNSTPEGRK